MSNPEPLKATTLKAWGYEECFAAQSGYTGKFLVIKPGWRCSLHYHPIKDETFVCIVGKVVVEFVIDDQVRSTTLTAERREPFHVPPGLPHRFYSANNEQAVLVEVSTRHDDSDVVRLEESGPLPEGA